MSSALRRAIQQFVTAHGLGGLSLTEVRQCNRISKRASGTPHKERNLIRTFNGNIYNILKYISIMAEFQHRTYKKVLEILVYLLAIGAILFTVIMIIIAVLR